jgi:tetratricopeptide (TPR) repeat protein
MADTDLRGRRAECGVLDGLLEGVRGGRSAVLVVRGEAGVGKTALLDYAIESAPDLHFARAAGVESEMELAFAGLHQLCGPMLDRLGQLPGPQRDALRIAFALEAGPAPDRFLVGLAVLSLLSEMAGDRPLVCVVDDVQWMDRVSVQVLAFAARRLLAEAVLVIFAAREPGADLHGLPELRVEGLRHADARKLLGSVVRWPLDERVADRIVAETRGNPLALLELPRGRSMAELAGGFGLPEVLPLPGRIRENFLRRVESLPERTRLLLAVAAADPTGDPALMHGAAQRLGLGVEVAEQAEETELFHIGGIGGQIVFRHPLMRSAAYRAVSPEDRRRVHAALAQVTNAQTDPDRRAWHLAQAMSGPDEEVAAELERSADRAQARGGLAAAAAFLERSMVLTAEPGRRAKRTLAAAQANISAGAFDKALDMLARAEAGPLDEFSGARMDLLRGQIAFSSGLGSDAPLLLLKAAKRLESLNLEMARETYMSAWMAALFAGRFAGGGDLAEVSQAARSMPRPAGPAGLAGLVLDGLALLVTEGPAVAAPALQRAASAFASPDISVEEGIRWGWLGQAAASALWDDVRWRAILVRQVQLARDAGALDHLPIELASLGTDAAWRGDFAAAEALIAETAAVCAATGARSAPFVAMLMASLRGDHAEAAPLIEATIAEAAATGQGIAVTYAHWASAILNNGLGRYADALAAAQDASQETPPLYMSMLGDGPGGVDQADVAERLREVADHLAAARVDLLGQQAHVVDGRHGALERRGGLVELSGQRLRVRQPERAEQEGSLLAGQAVMSQVAVHQAALVGQPGGDRVDGRLHPRVVAGQEAGDRQHQAGCVKIFAAEGLGEGTGLIVPAALVDGRADLVAGGGPPRRPVGRAELRGEGDRPVERDPAHQLGVQEVPWLAADFPDALVLLLPPARGRIRRGGEELLGDRVELTQLVGQPLRGAEQLAVHVKLALGPRPVADPHRAAGPPAGQVRQSRSERSCSPPTPNMICRSFPAAAGRPRRRPGSRRTCRPHRGTPPPTGPPWSGWHRAPRCSGNPSCARRRWPPAARSWARPRWPRSGRT